MRQAQTEEKRQAVEARQRHGLVERACAIGIGILAAAPPALGRAQDLPPQPFIDPGACPFECCIYREWFAERAIILWDRPNGRRVVARLRKDEPVEALTGEVHSTPLRVVANRDLPDEGIKAGDIFYVLHYTGEDSWKIWHHGRVLEVDEGATTGVPQPASTWWGEVKSTWWVKVRTQGGLIGWAISKGRNFRNQDECG